MLAGLFFLGLGRAEAGPDHAQAEHGEQGEGDPVIPGLDVLGGGEADGPAEYGVMASMTPKMAPVRRASRRQGLCRLAPLPTAAAKASVDMAKARNIREAGFIVTAPAGLDPQDIPARPAWRGDAFWSRQP